jgi:hypothetical protein
MAELGLTANHSAASRRDAPDAMASTTRSRNSKEHGFGIDPPPKIESVPPDSLIQTIPGNTDSTQVKSALSGNSRSFRFATIAAIAPDLKELAESIP